MQQSIPKYQDIFVPGGLPRHTYNPRSSLNLEKLLEESKNNLCKLAIVTGQTKTGKTVLTRTILNDDNSIWIDGGIIREEKDFWDTIAAELDAYTDIEKSAENESEAKIGTKATAEAGILVAKGSAELSGEYVTHRASGRAQAISVSSRVSALKKVREVRPAIIIDDFHYIPKDIQGHIVRALKPAIFEGVSVVIIAIPHRRYDAIKVEREMTGRILPIEIPTWGYEELKFIPETGFKIFNKSLTNEITDLLIRNSFGSPHLMQEFCKKICSTIDITHGNEFEFIEITPEHLNAIFSETAETIGRPIFEKLARGPQSRTDRIQRTLVSGENVDIYELVLNALAELKPGLVTISYDELRASIRNICGEQMPQAHETTRVLKHMSQIASTDASSSPVIDFEEEDRQLHITDPFFAFFLRWGHISK